VILADDFTGACDAAGPFAAAGYATTMTLAAPATWPDGVEVLAVDLDVRERSFDDARATAFGAARALALEARLFVKIDSTLRGPVAALIEGALDGSGIERGLVAPAFPEQGREVLHGELRVAGQPPGPLVRAVLGAADARCSVYDSGELDDVARRSDALLVGSSGLARRVAGSAVPGSMPEPVRTVLVVAGSPAEATRRQLERLPAGVAVLRTPAAFARDQGEAASGLAEEVGRATRPELLVLTGGETARRVCERLAVRGVRLLGEVQPGMPFGHLRGGVWDGVLVVTKAGGFGGPDALLDAVRLLGPSSLETS
jgi:uncharacterized protein YgbK (DUF1537 family)